MGTRRELSDLIRAMARSDWDTADRLLDQLGQSGWGGGSQVIGAAFALAVDRRFRGKNLEDIARFVADTRARYQDGSDLPALAMEGMIRAVLGEVHLVDDIAPDVAFSAQIAVLGTLLQDEDLTDEQLEQFIRTVEATARRIHVR
ncbi:hypothetical protein ACFP2T_12620 [Plantactinospora solaniradicis]|uniref:Uncharacterized protein n=1 Tax=Plantactinospora solaniradicis TaxID=1723736 RepID=A0ABW1K6F5_9ACTN